MATYLFHMVEDKPERVLVEALQVEGMLAAGYCVCAEDLNTSTEESEELTIDEVKELAIAAGITVGRKGIKTLKKELGI